MFSIPSLASRTKLTLQRVACCASTALLLAIASGARAQTSSAEATTVLTASPAGVVYDAQGNLYIALQNDHKVVMVATNGLISTFAGTGEQGFAGDGGAATSALLDSPGGIAIDGSGNLYIADTHNQRIRKIVNGIITTVAGTGVAGFSGDGGSPTAAQLARPIAVSVDASGNLYIADSDNHRIRKVASGTITTVAGDGEQTFAGDGAAATSAVLDSPSGVVVDPNNPGRFFISDTHNQRVRVVDPNGNITTFAGTGVKGFGGDGNSASSAVLARPFGLAVDGAGALYIVDKDNNRVRMVSGATITTVIGDGEQGFGGDTGSATSALLDNPTAVALGPDGVVTLSDTHNQRTRTITSTSINTVAGIAPQLTEGIVLSGAIADVYGTGTLAATFSNGSKTATGTATLLDGGVPTITAPFNADQATFNLSKINAGAHTFVVTFSGDTQNAPATSGEYLVTIAQATQTINFPQPASPVIFTTGATETLTATSSSGLPITYTVTGPATVSGSTLTISGAGTVVVTATAGNQNYVTTSVSRTITVTGLGLTALSPSTAALGDPAKLVTLTGSGFLTNSVILVNGTAVPTTFIDGNTLSTTLPASTFQTVQTLQFSVSDPSQNEVSNSLPFTVTALGVSATLSAPPTSQPGTQPTVTLALASAYPVPVQATLTLSFVPGANGVDDPAIRFANGTTTDTFTIPAGQTSSPAIPIQTGTVSGVIHITLALTVDGVDVTPANTPDTLITIPPSAPTVTSISVTRSGKTLTVIAAGYTDTRQATQALFQFTAASGHSIKTPELTVDVTTPFTTYFSDAASDAYGSTFLYTQVFSLDEDATVVGSVTITLTNSVGTSAPVTTP